jgi:hypothetical protein
VKKDALSKLPHQVIAKRFHAMAKKALQDTAASTNLRPTTVGHAASSREPVIVGCVGPTRLTYMPASTRNWMLGNDHRAELNRQRRPALGAGCENSLGRTCLRLNSLVTGKSLNLGHVHQMSGRKTT